MRRHRHYEDRGRGRDGACGQRAGDRADGPVSTQEPERVPDGAADGRRRSERQRQEPEFPGMPPGGTDCRAHSCSLAVRIEGVREDDVQLAWPDAARDGVQARREGQVIDANHEAAPDPARCHMADHHSRGSPGPPMMAITS